ncbi:DUF6153 family protein [Streptomyces sp. NPDC001222]|uniref:DUF6153 family protein n=1 Tax=Streptomyces sp. NPDC001222 TaxID=3364548 RepID=UPI00369E66D7
MTSGPRIRLAARRARWMPLVLTVVAGVLAMHALSPSGNPSAGAHIMATGPGVAAHHAETIAAHHAETTAAHASDAGPCRMVSGTGQGGMVMDHAGGTCAARGTAASYVPPALAPAPIAPIDPASVAPGHRLAGATDGRAPPDLSELQLLRI